MFLNLVTSSTLSLSVLFKTLRQFLAFASILLICILSSGCEDELIQVRIEREDAFVLTDALQDAKTIVLKPEFSTNELDESRIPVEGSQLVLANPVLSLVPFPLNDDRYQRWVILEDANNNELARGWLDAARGEENVVTLSTLCDS